MSSSANIVTPLATFSYVNIWVARGFRNADGTTGTPSYSTTFIFSKTSDMSAIDAAFNGVVAADFPDGMPFNSRTPAGVNAIGAYMDGAVRYPNDPFYADKWIISASQDEDRFDHVKGVLNADSTPIIDKSQMYSGAIGHGMISFYGYQGGSKGVSCSLHGVLKTADGEHMGGGAVDAASGFVAAGVVQGGAVAQQAPTQMAPPAMTPPAMTPAPSAPVAPPAHVMSPAANGLSYEEYINAGWTHQQMVDGGLVVG